MIERRLGVTQVLADPWASVSKRRTFVGSSRESAVLMTPWFSIEIGYGCATDKGLYHWHGVHVTWDWARWWGFRRSWSTGVTA